MDNFDIKDLFHRPSEEMPSTEFIGGIFPRKHISIVAAKAGIGKTWFLLKLLTDLSNGGCIFNGIKAGEPPRKCLFFCGDTGLEMINERQRLMYDKANDDNLVLVSRIEAAKYGMTMDLTTKRDTQPIVDAIRAFHPDIIVFDTLMSFRTDDESAMQNTNQIMSRLKWIAEENNAAILATHHLRKRQGDDQKFDQDEIVGSSALVRQCGIAWILARLGWNYTLKPVKAWWNVPEIIEYRMETQLGQVIFTQPTWTQDVNITQRRINIQKFLESLQDDETISANELCEKFKCERHFASRILHQYAEIANPDARNGQELRFKRKTD